MFAPRLALRLLLSLVLVLNGIGTSVAATRMVFEHATHSGVPSRHTALQAQPTAMSGCHHHELSSPASKSAPAIGDTGAGKTQLPDCCKSKCDCACLQATPAAIMTALVQGVPATRGLSVLAISQAYPAPALSDLNRPPIG